MATIYLRHFHKIEFSTLSSWLIETRHLMLGGAVLALVPESEKSRVSDLQAVFNEHGIALLGAIFPLLITEDGFVEKGVSFVVFSDATDKFLIDGLGSVDDANRIAHELNKGAIPSAAINNQQLFVIFDGMLPNTGSLMASLFEQLNHRFKYTGVNAGSETFKPMPCLFDNHHLVSNGVIGIAICSEIDVSVEHAYPVTKSLMRATSTHGNRIDKINGQPAMTVYQGVIAAEFDIELTQENFYDYAVHYPFGLVGSLEVLVRIPVGFSDDGSIYCVGEVPPNSMLRQLKAPHLSDSACISRTITALGGRKENPLLIFYCAGRRMHFGQEAEIELTDLLKQSGSGAALGALSLGEIGSDSEFGFPEFHNAAVVCVR